VASRDGKAKVPELKELKEKGQKEAAAKTSNHGTRLQAKIGNPHCSALASL
jgi:hypothetical protein